MNPPGLHVIIFAVLFVLLAAGLVTLLLSRSTYVKIKAIPYAFVYGLGVVLWLASLFYSRYVADTFLAHRVSFSAAYILALGTLGLALSFPNSTLGKHMRRVLAVDMVLGLIGIGFIFFTEYILTAANFSAPKTHPILTSGKLFLAFIAANFIAAVVIFVRRYLTELGNRLYFNYIVLAFILLALFGLTSNLVLPLSGVMAFTIVGPLAALLPFVAVVYSLGITDINDVSYVVAQLLQVGVRLAAASLLIAIGWFLHSELKLAYDRPFWLILMSVITGLGIILVYLFGGPFDRYVENKIAYSRLSPDEARSKVIIGLGGAIGLERNAAPVLKFIKQSLGVRAAGIALLAKDGTFWSSGDLTLPEVRLQSVLPAVRSLPAKRSHERALISVSTLPDKSMRLLEMQGIYAVQPLHTESGIVGLYLIGQKFSQEIFTRQDATLMHAITEISDLSLERATFYNEIQAFNATLQQRIDNATLRLRRANKRLKTLDALKDDFISMASHQLRSPATSVHEAIQMLNQDYTTPKDRRELTALAEASSERLVGVVTDMLSMARIQAGHFVIEKTPVDLAELVDRAVLQASGLAKQKSTKLSFTPPTEPIKLRADRAKLNEAMSNYIENAIKYSPESSTVTINLRQDGNKVYFEVQDAGIGVPEKERKELFGKFYRASNARLEEPNGNGIGLFVVKTVAEALGGQAYYRPLSRGSLFGFWLPA